MLDPYASQLRTVANQHRLKSELAARYDFLASKLHDKFGITPLQLSGKRRTAKIVNMRALIAHVLRDSGYSYPEIGTLLRRDHTSVIFLTKRELPDDLIPVLTRLKEINLQWSKKRYGPKSET